jgi:hypothetical protein
MPNHFVAKIVLYQMQASTIPITGEERRGGGGLACKADSRNPSLSLQMSLALHLLANKAVLYKRGRAIEQGQGITLCIGFLT